ARRFAIALIAELLLERRLRLRVVELADEIVLFEEDEALLGAQLIERDAQCDRPQPRIESDVLPRELRDVDDDLGVRLRERFLGRGLRAEPRQEHAPVQAGPMLLEQRPKRLAIAGLGLLDEILVGGVGLGAAAGPL